MYEEHPNVQGFTPGKPVITAMHTMPVTQFVCHGESRPSDTSHVLLIRSLSACYREIKLSDGGRSNPVENVSGMVTKDK